MSRVTRRQFVRFAGLSSAAALLTACAPKVVEKVVEKPVEKIVEKEKVITVTPVPAQVDKFKISMWFHDPLYVQFYDMMGKEWAEKHPEYQIEWEILQVPGGEIATKTISAIAAGSGAPDINGIMLFDFPRFLKGGAVENGLVDLTDMIGERRKEFFETAWSPFLWEGKIYAVESALCPVAHYYRRDILEEAGIQVPFDTWDDFIAAGQKLRGKDKYMILGGNTGLGDFEMYMLQGGANLFDVAGNVIIDSPEMAEALQLYVDFQLKYETAMPFDSTWSAGAMVAFKEGKVASAIGADWYSDYVLKLQVPDQAGKWGVAPVPAFGKGGNRGTRSGGTGMAVLKQSKHADVAFQIIEYAYLTFEGQVRRYETIHYFPTMKAAVWAPQVTETPDPFFADQNVGRVFAEVSEQIPPYYTHPFQFEARTTLGDEITAVLKKQKTVAEALKATSEQVKAFIAQG